MKIALLILSLFPLALHGQTISEKRSHAGNAPAPIERRVSRDLRPVNRQYAQLRDELQALYTQVPDLYAQGAEEDLAYLMDQIREVREQLACLQADWQAQACAEDRSGMYALWHQPWTTIEQLVMDYGSDDYVYLIPVEIGSLRLSIGSNLPIPRESFDDLLQMILTQNGIGIRQLTPLVRELFSPHGQPASVAAITGERSDLSLYRPTDRICFVLSPPSAQVPQVSAFLTRFLTPATTFLYRFGRQLFLVGPVDALQELLKLYDFADAGTEEHQYQMVSLNKLSAAEMGAIVRLYFEREGSDTPLDLKVMAPNEPGNALFLAGPADLIRQAKRLIEGVEAQVADPREMVVYTYAARHLDVEELAAVLSQVYNLMRMNPSASIDADAVSRHFHDSDPAFGADSSGDPNLAIDPSPVTTQPVVRRQEPSPVLGNFVVSPKTGTLVMVVEQDLLPQLKSLLRKLDVPTRMVKIDVLLFEKRVSDQSRFGLDLLRVGSAASDSVNRMGFSYAGRGTKTHEAGIVEFLVSRVKDRLVPAFDFAYDFLMSREDIRINAAPSVMAVNNTEAKIELVEEISIDNGTFIDPDFKDNILKRSFTRTQYGITIAITPSINSSQQSWGAAPDYITLDTSIGFDTPRAARDDRPPVIRRRITNQVRIPNGQTVVLGGLRSQMSEGLDSGLPFFSEIPYFGKIFGSSKASDRDTEMFIFITPTIVDDPATDLARQQHEMMCRRPGDLPEFLMAVQYARDRQACCAYERTLKALFGQEGPCTARREYVYR